MRVLDAGHRYELNNLKSNTTTIFQFYKDSDIHGEENCADGPSCQEVIRMLIDRVKYLDSEKAWEGNEEILFNLRAALLNFEVRALGYKLLKDELKPEEVEVGNDGHFFLIE